MSLDGNVQEPAAQVPGAANVRSLVASTQTEAGAAVQLTPAHGSVTQAPALHPSGHVESCQVYVQAPPEHDPGDRNVRRLTPSRQVAAGGALQATPAHGSPLQTPLAQPNPQVVSLGVYVQPPPLHTPPPKVRRVEASTQYEAGGVVQETPRHGSPLQVPPAQPLGHAVSWDE